MSDLISEIKEELGKERIVNFFKRNSKGVAISIVSLIAVVALVVWYKSYSLGQIHEAGGHYLAAIGKMRAQNLPSGLEKFELASVNSTNYAALAKFNLASFSMFNKDYAKAAATFKEVADNTSFHPALRDLAALYTIQMLMEAKIIDNKESITRLEALKDTMAFSANVQELLAVLYIKEGENEKAKDVLNKIVTNTKNPATLIRRARYYSSLLVK